MSCTRRMFLLGTATTFAGALLAACGNDSIEVDVADVPVGSAVIVGSYIIAQPTAGEYKAYSTVCPHQNGVINQIDGDEVTCPKHNSVFSIVDGSVVSGPARNSLFTQNIEIEGSTATVG